MHTTNDEAIVLKTPEAIEFFRLAQLKAVLSLEIKGLKVWRGQSAYVRAKKLYGLKGSRQSVLTQLTKMVDDDILHAD